MLKLAVIGKDVSRSLSPAMHGFILGQWGAAHTYEAVSIPPAAFAARAEQLFHAYDGFNVTIPFKAEIIPFLRECAGDAAVFGAVNTVRCSDLSGHNTDGLGFMLMLRNNGVDARGKDVLLLGAGGAGRAVAKKLSAAGARVFVYDRNPSNSAAVAAECPGAVALGSVCPADYYMIINATGVGMHDTEGLSPVGEDVLSRTEIAVDLIYVPAKSAFLSVAEGLGKRIINGMAMLFYQAYYAECIYFGARPDDAQAAALFEKYLKEA